MLVRPEELLITYVVRVETDLTRPGGIVGEAVGDNIWRSTSYGGFLAGQQENLFVCSHHEESSFAL